MIAASQRPDFADWLSPVLVKELRQGVRSRIFMSAFYLTQLLMIACVILNLAARGANESPEDLLGMLNGLFWFMISVPLLFIMPMRGFGMLHSEMKAGTLELVYLSRLSSWRIVAGKWMSLVVQTLLLVCGALPYVLVRYFLGGVDIIEDLQNLVYLIVGSAVLSAVTIAISPYESRLLRVLFVIGLVIGLQALSGLLLAWMTIGRLGGSATAVSIGGFYLGALLFVPAFVFLCLEMGASRLAPTVENHALRKRLIGLYFGAVSIGYLLANPKNAGVLDFALLLLAPVIIDALAEPMAFAPVVLKKYVHRGPLRRALAVFFSPGWGSASWYVALLTVLGAVLVLITGRITEPMNLLHYTAYLGALIVPAALIRLILPRTEHFLGFYIGIQLFLSALTLLLRILSEYADWKGILTWISPIPTSTLLLSLTDQIDMAQVPFYVQITGVVTLAALVVLLGKTIKPWSDIVAVLGQPRAKDA